jgi:c-di-GMP-binding flagellar brake protein YcgR
LIKKVVEGMQDRREYPRIRRKRKVGFLLSDGSIEYLWTMDISRGGMQLHTEHMVDLGDEFKVRFGVYDYAKEQYVTVTARIEIVHKVYDGTAGGFRIGVRFLSFDGDGEDVYNRHLKDLELQL